MNGPNLTVLYVALVGVGLVCMLIWLFFQAVT